MTTPMTKPNAFLTLVSDPARLPLSEAFVTDIQARLRAETDLEAGEPNWLSPGEAVDLPLTEAPGEALKTMLENALGEAPVDFAFTSAQERRKRLLLADMDSTMITVECVDELADFANLREPVAKITERAMRGELDFEPALRERVALLKGLTEDHLEQAFAQRVKLSPGARTLVRTMAGHGAYCALVSGGFTFFTKRVAAACGFHEHRGNTLYKDVSGTLTGKVGEPILGREAKLETLRELRNARGLPQAATLAIGDGANDLAMIGEAGLGLAYRAKPAVAAAAGAKINHTGLTTALFYQGYQRADFVTD